MLTLALYLQGLPLLLMRSDMLEVMHEEFVTMARMKGLSEWRIVIHHAARNALLPVVTAFALGVGLNMGGNVVVETVFSWPGIGRLLVQAVSTHDYPLAQGAFLLIALVLVVMNFVADLLYMVLDPRVSAWPTDVESAALMRPSSPRLAAARARRCARLLARSVRLRRPLDLCRCSRWWRCSPMQLQPIDPTGDPVRRDGKLAANRAARRRASSLGTTNLGRDIYSQLVYGTAAR